MSKFTDEEIRTQYEEQRRRGRDELADMLESLLEERQTIAAVALERASQICDDYLKGPMPASTGVLYISKKIRSLIVEGV